MASLKIVLRKNKKRKDGKIPLALRISKSYQTTYLFLGQYINVKEWDEKNSRVKRSHPNSKRINNLLLKKLSEANDILLSSETDLSSKDLKSKIEGKYNKMSFFKLASQRIENKYQQGIFSVAKSELSMLYNIEEFLSMKSSTNIETATIAIKQRRKTRISKAQKGEYVFTDAVKDFSKKKTLRFEDITLSFIRKYKAFCSLYLNQQKRTITNQLIFIRTLFNLAIKDGIVDEKHYPFAENKEKIRLNPSLKIGLNKDEIEKIETLELEENSSIWHTRNAWLLSFYFAGIRISDLVKLRWSDFKDGRLLYVMNKNEKPLSLLIPFKAQEIIDQYVKYKGENKGFVFPFLSKANLKSKKDIFTKSRNATSLLNKHIKRVADLCNIDKTLSNHISRHSFGNIAGDTIHPLMLQKLYRHSDLKTTILYQSNFIHKEADEALKKVLDF